MSLQYRFKISTMMILNMSKIKIFSSSNSLLSRFVSIQRNSLMAIQCHRINQLWGELIMQNILAHQQLLFLYLRLQSVFRVQNSLKHRILLALLSRVKLCLVQLLKHKWWIRELCLLVRLQQFLHGEAPQLSITIINWIK